MYKLKVSDGVVNALMRSGKDLVKTTLKASVAQEILNKGETTDATIESYGVCVDDTWYFETEPRVAHKGKGNE